MRPGGGAQQVVGVFDVGDPVAQRLVDGVLEGRRAGPDRDDLGTEQLHPGDVEGLPLGVHLAHVDDAFEAEQRAGGRGRHTVLSGPGLGDDPALAHPFDQQRLPEHVVDLVRAGVVEVFPLEQDPRAAGVLGEPGGLGQQRGASGVVAQQVVELGEILRIVLRLGVLGGELVLSGDQRLRHEPAAVGPEVPAFVRVVPLRHGLARPVGARSLCADGHCLTSCDLRRPLSSANTGPLPARPRAGGMRPGGHQLGDGRLGIIAGH